MTRKKKAPSRKKPEKKEESVSGTYVYDAESDRIVKVSDRIPSVASKSGAHSHGSPCGQGPCSGGSCPYKS